jgi:hypothetical protein
MNLHQIKIVLGFKFHNNPPNLNAISGNPAKQIPIITSIQNLLKRRILERR